MVITKEELAELPIETFPGNIIVIDTVEALDKAYNALSKESIIGFDTETKPAFKKGVSHSIALLQLSTNTTCYLFRLNKIGMPEKVMMLLNDTNIKKIGLSLKDDFAAIRKVEPLKPGNFIELQTFVKKYNIEDMGLQRIYGILFKKRITKGQRLSNWEADTLTEAQQSYAAIDAWACLKIYEKLLQQVPLA